METTRERSLRSTWWTQWGQFVTWAVIVNVCALTLYWAWRGSRSDVSRSTVQAAPDFTLTVSTNPSRNNVMSLAGDDQTNNSSEESILWARRVSSEINDLGREHEWAGEYYRGDGLFGNSLALAPADGFAFEAYWCSGTKPIVYGRVTEINGLLMLSPESASPTAGDSLPMLWMPLVWGERHYLIAPESWVSFVESVRAGREPRYDIFGDFYLRDGDEHVAVDGALPTPAAYGEAWRRSIHGKAIELGESTLSPFGRYRTTRLQLDVGRAHGVHASMTFYPDDSEDLQERAIVDAVREHECDVVLWQPSTASQLSAVGSLFSLLPRSAIVRSR